ncbi:hypothetical protein C7212DRAFT_346139 [Tuber magnatum]|uniref:Uncharacterized protein n=1 Tax=Tuber magnatum TaxID=42249 RepID=A0A317SLE0_9PEZI|nr:hypothetical protein C7212DRAFT_346139 [Tuber magnatum]
MSFTQVKRDIYTEGDAGSRHPVKYRSQELLLTPRGGKFFTPRKQNYSTAQQSDKRIEELHTAFLKTSRGTGILTLEIQLSPKRTGGPLNRAVKADSYYRPWAGSPSEQCEEIRAENEDTGGSDCEIPQLTPFSCHRDKVSVVQAEARSAVFASKCSSELFFQAVNTKIALVEAIPELSSGEENYRFRG